MGNSPCDVKGQTELISNNKNHSTFNKILFHWSENCEMMNMYTTLSSAFQLYQKRSECPTVWEGLGVVTNKIKQTPILTYRLVLPLLQAR